MTPNSKAVREAKAQERILASARVLARRAGIQADGLDTTHRDPGLQVLFRTEALADFLEALNLAQVPAPAHVKAEKVKP